MSQSTYAMESKQEAERLQAQQDAIPASGVLRTTGLAAGMRALDAGCGPGGVTHEMTRLVGKGGAALGVDLSDERIQTAKGLWSHVPNASFQVGDLRKLELPDQSFDYVFSQFVLEYLPQPQTAIRELCRVTRSGGKVVVVEIDSFGMANWPEPAVVTTGIAKLAQSLEGILDLFIGRKLYSMFIAAGLQAVKVHLVPIYALAGRADDRWLKDWEVRLRTLAPIAAKTFGNAETYAEFQEAYLAMLRDPNAFKYSVGIVTEGIKSGPAGC